ncbi:hypothetical protein E6H21_06735 [Candidatus Bathyarchaeota archaeon]|nr:MAG: hypothetical protein E6H21_06735 [Candidatus Bathyarchaeota archaeon]
MTTSSYQPDTVVLSALLLVGLVLGGSMFYVLVFPAKPKPIVCPSPTATCIDIPFGVSFDSSKNFVLSNVTITAGTFVQWKNHDESPHTATATLVPPGATKFDSGELDSGNTFFVQLTTPGLYTYHCNFHPMWMRGVIIVKP